MPHAPRQRPHPRGFKHAPEWADVTGVAGGEEGQLTVREARSSAGLPLRTLGVAGATGSSPRCEVAQSAERRQSRTGDALRPPARLFLSVRLHVFLGPHLVMIVTSRGQLPPKWTMPGICPRSPRLAGVAS